MKTFDFETALSIKEIEINLNQLISNNNKLLSRLGKFVLGDISPRLKYEGYITNGNIYFVSYAKGYKKTVEIKGRISDLGNIRKVNYTVNVLQTTDLMIRLFLMSLGFCFIISVINNLPVYLSLPAWLIINLILIKILIILDTKTCFKIGQKIFKVLITGENE